MRGFFILAYLLAMVVVVVSHVMLPAEVAIHFDASGEADDWAPRIVNTLLFAGLFSFFFVLFWWIPRLIVTAPPEMVNLPHKEYWLAQENRPRALEIFSRLMYEFGGVILAFFALMGALTTWANLSTPVQLDNGLFFTGLVLFLSYTVWWCVRLYRAFRVPVT